MKIRTKTLFILIIILFIAKSIVHLSLPMIAIKQGMDDAHVRIMMAGRGIILFFGVWQPFHFILLNQLYRISKEIYFAPRIFAILQNFILLILIFFVAKKQTKNKNIAIISSFLFLILPFFSIYTTFPITELLFNIFLLLGLLFFMEDDKHFWLSLIFFNLAHTIRFESWYLYPILLFFVIKKVGFKRSMVYSFLYFLYPIFYLYINYVKISSFIYPVSDFLAQTSPQFEGYNVMTVFNLLTKFIFIFGPNLIFIIFLFFDKKKTKCAINFYMSLFLLLILSIINTVAKVKDWLPDQHFYTSYLLFLPIIAEGIFFFLKKFKTKLVLFLLLFLYIFWFIRDDYFFVFKKNNLKPPEISSVIKNIQGKEYIWVYGKDYFPYDVDSVMYFTNKLNYVLLDEDEFLKKYPKEKIRGTIVIYDKINPLYGKCYFYYKNDRFKICNYF